jgi:tetratricopeptide (TPR) repeat protein
MKYSPKQIPDGNPNHRAQKNGFIVFLGWFFGIFFLLGAAAMLHHPPAAFFYFVLGFVLLPPGHNWIEKTFRFRFKTRIKTLFCTLLIICASPVVWYYADMDRKESESAQAKSLQEQREKEGSTRQDQLSKDSLNHYIAASDWQKKQHQLDEAAQQLQNARNFATNPQDRLLLSQKNDSIIQIRLEDQVAGGKYKSAIPQLTELILRNSTNADLLYTRALCYSHTGKISEAVQDCKAAAQLGDSKAAQLNDKINPVVKHVVGHCTRCCDGSTSAARGRGACSHHGGVCDWNSPIYEESRKYE